MKDFIGVVIFCVGVAVATCLISGSVCLAGFSMPNCEYTMYGYTEFYATLFCYSFIACFGGWCLVALGCAIDKFFTKGN